MPITLTEAIRRHHNYLTARNLSPRTIEGYQSALEALQQHTGDPPISTITEDQIAALITHKLNGHHKTTGRPLKPTTADTIYRKLKAFFNWTTRQGTTKRNPMQHLPAPKLPELTIPILTKNELRELVRSCNGHSFRDKRDRAIIRILIDNGLRRQELASIKLTDVDLKRRRITVMGKGQKARHVPIGLKTIDALQRYLQAREKHPRGKSTELWIGHRGPMKANGIYQTIKARAEQAGLEGIFTHRFRHTWAHRWLIEGGSEIDAMTIAGWSSPRMLQRYGKSAAQERALHAHRKIAPGDKI